MSRRNLFASLLLAFLLVAGIGAAISYLRKPPGARPGDTTAFAISHSGLNDETLTRLQDYARSNEPEVTVSTPAAAKPLPDVNTMIERLVARLETTPGDTKGWRMLGWSYFHTGRYEQAAVAYGRAVELEPNSAELRLSYEEAKAKAAETAASLQTDVIDKSGGGSRVARNAKADEASPPRQHDPAIRSMVDGLAERLERSPNDVDGWTRLMRSRVVLGEKEVAATAFRKALEVFKDDSAAAGKITAAAIELGLKAE